MPVRPLVSKYASLPHLGARPRSLTPYLFMLPALVMVILVSIVPIAQAFSLSLSRTTFLRVTGFAGLSNYTELLGSSEIQGDILRSVTYVLGSLALVLPLGVFLAVVLNQPMRFRGFFRTIVLLPWVISQTIAGLIWKWGLNPDYGPFTAAVGSLGSGHFDPLADPGQAMLSLIVVNVWLNYPFVVVMTLAALQGVPGELLEAGRVDGANARQLVVSIVLPIIRPTLLITSIMLTLLFFNMVTLVLTFTAGGPFSATTTLSLEAYNTSFQFFHFAQGSTLSVILFAMNILLSILYLKVIRTDASN